MSAKEKQVIQSYIDSPAKQRMLYRKTLLIVVISQIFGGAGLAAGITTGALLAQEMLGTDSFAGLPAALFTLGSAGAALLVGRLSQRFGRRTGLAAGFLAGGIGAAGVVMAALVNSFLILIVALLVYGAGTATNLQARYAGTDLASSSQRATAVSIAMVFTTLGAVIGPNLVNVTGKVAASFNVSPLAGPFILAAAAFTLSGLVILIFLRPDPFVVAKVIAEGEALKGNDDAAGGQAVSETNRRGVMAGALIMILTQMIMLAIMTMTPIHMSHHGHGLSAVGMVIGVHIGAMYLPSLITGILVDKYGRTTMVVAAGLTLLLSGVIAATAPAESLLAITAALALLGVGWNIGLISGTAIIVDATTFHTRAKTQGNVDVFIALAGATGGAMSGMVVGGFSFAVLAIGGGMVSLFVIPIIFWYQFHSRKKEVADEQNNPPSSIEETGN
ncbi:MFS transporter [Alteribacillus iranensis]|uniref:Predicted arabinose efflux permease, MFS family n=1 Tax=Alteribacillus iranensis TaxID=930128 RepID=A0A1I2FGD6_9BACI|nr:MFS transporter [Alteribacillus iranensis]SFF04472.1 Predicted arabinose efflux permease, MFS family [Alteribacillus iranensis]